MDKSDRACRIKRRHSGHILEFVAFELPCRGIIAADWPTAPGGVRRGAGERAELLHFAPGRWLVPEPAPELSAALEAATNAGAGALIDVSGKWEHLVIAGPGAGRLLASAIAVDAVLERRGCAAVTLFDCPAIIARQGAGFALWVQASYVMDFMATAQRFGAVVEI